MHALEELTDNLARDVLAAAKRYKEDDLVERISEVLGASSTTAQEAFMTAVRVRRAEARAREMLRAIENRSSPGNAAE